VAITESDFTCNNKLYFLLMSITGRANIKYLLTIVYISKIKCIYDDDVTVSVYEALPSKPFIKDL
jgi:hypothetical protein